MSSLLSEAVVVPDSISDLARAVLIYGPVSRGELAEQLGLSLPTLTRLSRPLIERGILYEVDDLAQNTAGRPTKPLDVRPDAGYYMGVKLTGDQAIGVLTDIKANELVRLEANFTDRRVGTVHRILVKLYQGLIEKAHYASEVKAIGISIGGFVRSDGTIGYASYLGWENVDLAGPLTSELGIPVYIENDIVAVTGAEHWFGLGRGHTDFAVITMGAGLGYGLVRRDRVVNTQDARLGIGTHIILDVDGPSCSEGYKGCAAELLTTPALLEQAFLHYGHHISFEELVQKYHEGDVFARSVFSRAARALGNMIKLVSSFALVNTIVLAGEAIELFQISESEVLEEIARDRQFEFTPIEILVAEGNFVAWARGAAAVAIQSSFDRLLVE